MRTAFINALIDQARLHPRIFLAVGDLGFSVVEPFAREFPHRFLNAGVAEQNMTGVAAGLASEGWHVFTYSIANFPTLRCFEQIRNDVCYHRLPVTVVAVGAGLAYGNLGYSHHGVQDIAVMRSLPHLTLLSPADPAETTACVRHLAEHPGPSYLRLGKAGEKALHDRPLTRHAPIEVRSGDGILAIAATGSTLALALLAADLLNQQDGLRASVYSCPWLKPLATSDLSAIWRHSTIVTIEEHVDAGGFGELLRGLAPHKTIFSCLALPDANESVGNQNYLRQNSKLTVEAIVTEARKILQYADAGIGHSNPKTSNECT